MQMETRQKTRLFVLVFYVGLLLGANFLAFGEILPLNGSKGLWFYSGLASILLGSLLVTPFYSKPVDALSYAVVAGIALYSVHDWDNWAIFERMAFSVAMLFCLLVLLISFTAILTKDSISVSGQKWSNTFRILANVLGNQSVVFSVVMIFALIVFHRSSAKEMFVITLAWVVTVIIQPEEYVAKLSKSIKKLWTHTISFESVGDVVAYQLPEIVLIRQKTITKIPFGAPFIFKDDCSLVRIGVVLGYIGRDEALLVRSLMIDVSAEVVNQYDNTLALVPINTAVSATGLQEIIENLNVQPYNIVGIVASDTNIEYLYFEVIQERELEEGRLVEVLIKEEPVIYQVINGITKEDVVFQKNTYGYARAKAQKIGRWDEVGRKFVPVKWIPRLNSPVYLKEKEQVKPDKSSIGCFPGTSYFVGIKSIDQLVTHNTAILGILGIGKSMLSIELIERMIAEKIKVVCLDMTNQYAIELSDFYDAENEPENICKIQEAGDKDKDSWAENPEDGGSLSGFSQAILEDLHAFIETPDHFLKIYNPSQLFASKQVHEPKSYQTGGQWQRGAAVWTVTPVEVTRIIAEKLLEVVQEKGMTDQARVCLVLEEAHSLVPEFNSVASEGDKVATSGTSRVILQGRKYGLGCLLITQRTANVTKTILNQCNSIFALRTFDDTGKNFLSNFIGSEYANIIHTLQERQAVFFGKASSCENPVLIRLNDQQDFRRCFRGEPESCESCNCGDRHDLLE
ncbi:MAG: DUF87 domain-containing protein [Veillonellales bacterium]